MSAALTDRRGRVKRRTKSIDDIRAQLRRIENSPNLTPQREAQAWFAADRYEQNIRRRQRDQRRQAVSALLNDDMKTFNALDGELNSRQYSKNTYMGNSNG